MLQVPSRNSQCFLSGWGVVFLLQAACSITDYKAATTFQTMSPEIETPIEACPNISGTYEFIGTPLPGMPLTWRGAAKRTWRGTPTEGWKLTVDRFLWRYTPLKNEEAVTEVEILQDQTKIQVRFKGPFGQEVVVLPERPDDQIGCGKGKIILLRIREAIGESVTGTVVFKHTYFKSADGSLHLTVQSVAYLRSLFFFWTMEELQGAWFAPRR